ncbi:hypothetical protein AVEN_197643-1 [Araneus ventricosus]|uniref:Retrotransposon gag domain-containing protein n=1 Tax=Araneus ventricosus TaxID=182803 RepID=A0A4Y2JGM0_ARAVE|nr:hypothetical protein AVEN_197643-1 [Araneus ventricosus]
MADEGEALRNPSLLSSIKNLNGPNAPEFFRTLEETAPLGLWSKDQLVIITKLEGGARSFFEASLAGQELNYDTLKEKFLNQFQKRDNFASCFTQFSTAVQLPSERVKDFVSRIEGLAQNSFGDKTVGKRGNVKAIERQNDPFTVSCRASAKFKGTNADRKS